MAVFFLFVFRVYVVFCFLVFGCQYQCNQLPGKTRLKNGLLCVEGTLNPTHSLTVLLTFCSNICLSNITVCFMWCKAANVKTSTVLCYITDTSVNYRTAMIPCFCLCHGGYVFILACWFVSPDVCLSVCKQVSQQVVDLFSWNFWTKAIGLFLGWWSGSALECSNFSLPVCSVWNSVTLLVFTGCYH